MANGYDGVGAFGEFQGHGAEIGPIVGLGFYLIEDFFAVGVEELDVKFGESGDVWGAGEVAGDGGECQGDGGRGGCVCGDWFFAGG